MNKDQNPKEQFEPKTKKKKKRKLPGGKKESGWEW
jgi:hypothetical protein